MMYAKIALFGLFRRKGRTFFTAFAIGVAIAMAILLVSIGVGMKQGTAAMYEKDVDYRIVPQDSSVTDIVSNSEKTMLGNVHKSVEIITSNPDITYATPVLNRLIYASFSDKAPKVILGMGVIPGGTDTLIPGHNLTYGDPNFISSAATGEALINEKTARLLGLKIGDSLKLGTSSTDLNTSFRVMGIITQTQYSLSPVVVLHLSELQRLTGNLEGDRANYIIAEGSNANDYLKSLFPDSVVLGSSEYSVYSIVSDKKILATAIAVSAVSLFIAILFISSTMIMSINEKKQEFALMQAIGISWSSIAKMVLYESVFLSVLGAILGIVVSKIGQVLLNIIILRIFEVDLISVIDPVLQVCGVGIALGAGVLSGLIPVLMARPINIVSMLGDL